MYSPIKADRWSCGHVILHHVMVGMTMNADRRLLTFTNRLITKDPQQQPSLLESHVASVLMSRPRQHLVDVDGESMELPDAKRPRLTEMISQSNAVRIPGAFTQAVATLVRQIEVEDECVVSRCDDIPA